LTLNFYRWLGQGPEKKYGVDHMLYQVISRRNVTEKYPQYQWGRNSVDSVPLPVSDFQIGKYGIVDRWYTPDEMPVIPTGWVYELTSGEVLIEQRLYNRFISD
jgi:hypothetical protein